MKIATTLILTLSLVWLAVPAGAQQARSIALEDVLTARQFKECGLDKLSAAELARLDKVVQSLVTAARAVPVPRAAPATPEMPGPQRRALTFEDLLGGRIKADDGKFLGKITRNNIDPDSILNEVGEYGSALSATSMFNDAGVYGNARSPMSPFNPAAATPPRVFTRDGTFVGYLTMNTAKSPRIDPKALMSWLRSRN